MTISVATLRRKFAELTINTPVACFHQNMGISTKRLTEFGRNLGLIALKGPLQPQQQNDVDRQGHDECNHGDHSCKREPCVFASQPVDTLMRGKFILLYHRISERCVVLRLQFDDIEMQEDEVRW